MGSIPPNFPLSLQSWPAKESNPTTSTALTLLQRINYERRDQGGFRELTQEGLLQEIAAADADQGSGSSDEEEEAGEKDPLKQLYATREELLRHLSEAQGGVSLALDFVSFLLSRHNPIEAETTMSEYLKGTLKDPDIVRRVPPGSLGAEKVTEPLRTQAQREDDRSVARGWRIQTITKSCDVLLASATRLEKEIEIETKYWEEVLSIDGAGWKVCRIPQEKNTLGVRFGFSEGADAFKHSSLAALRRGPDGDISLDQGLQATEPKALRVRIKSEDRYASSACPPLIPDDGQIVSRIIQARNTVFASELWQELTREARTLMPYGVSIADDTITYPFKDKLVVLDLVPLGYHPAPPPQPDDKLAEGIFLALNLLLIYVHRMNHHRRTRPPPPLRGSEKKVMEYALIRPILTRLSHEKSIKLTRELMEPLSKTLSSAGLPTSYNQETIPPPSFRIAPTERIIHSLIDGLEVVTTFNIMPETIIKVMSLTNLYPTASTAYKIHITPDTSPLHILCPAPTGRKYEEAPIEDWMQVENYILFATSCALAYSILASQPDDATEKWTAAVQPNVLQKRDGSSHKKLTFTAERVKKGQGTAVRCRVAWDKEHGTLKGSYDWISSEAMVDGIEEMVKPMRDIVAKV